MDDRFASQAYSPLLHEATIEDQTSNAEIANRLRKGGNIANFANAVKGTLARTVVAWKIRSGKILRWFRGGSRDTTYK